MRRLARAHFTLPHQSSPHVHEPGRAARAVSAARRRCLAEPTRGEIEVVRRAGAARRACESRSCTRTRRLRRTYRGRRRSSLDRRSGTKGSRRSPARRRRNCDHKHPRSRCCTRRAPVRAARSVSAAGRRRVAQNRQGMGTRRSWSCSDRARYPRSRSHRCTRRSRCTCRVRRTWSSCVAESAGREAVEVGRASNTHARSAREPHRARAGARRAVRAVAAARRRGGACRSRGVRDGWASQHNRSIEGRGGRAERGRRDLRCREVEGDTQLDITAPPLTDVDVVVASVPSTASNGSAGSRPSSRSNPTSDETGLAAVAIETRDAMRGGCRNACVVPSESVTVPDIVSPLGRPSSRTPAVVASKESPSAASNHTATETFVSVPSHTYATPRPPPDHESATNASVPSTVPTKRWTGGSFVHDAQIATAQECDCEPSEPTEAMPSFDLRRCASKMELHRARARARARAGAGRARARARAKAKATSAGESAGAGESGTLVGLRGPRPRLTPAPGIHARRQRQGEWREGLSADGACPRADTRSTSTGPIARTVAVRRTSSSTAISHRSDRPPRASRATARRSSPLERTTSTRPERTMNIAVPRVALSDDRLTVLVF